MLDSLRVGVVGVGHMGSYHVAALSEILDANLVAVCDLVPSRVRELADRYGRSRLLTPLILSVA